jgi:hypothetical protein
MVLWGIDMEVTDKMIKAALEAWFGEPVNEPYDEHVDNMRFAMQAAIQTAWVSVDDELPPRDLSEVLVLTGGYYHVAEYDNDHNSWFNGDVYLYDVTHWMPLPEFKEHS